MVEFIRDVVIVLALLITLVAVALNPGADAESSNKMLEQRSGLTNVPSLTPGHAERVIASASAPQASV